MLLTKLEAIGYCLMHLLLQISLIIKMRIQCLAPNYLKIQYFDVEL
jgi:hypothetical protein